MHMNETNNLVSSYEVYFSPVFCFFFNSFTEKAVCMAFSAVNAPHLFIFHNSLGALFKNLA